MTALHGQPLRHWNIAAHVCTHGAILSDLAQFRKTCTIFLYRTDVIAQVIIQIEAPRHGQLNRHPSQEDDYLSVRLGATRLRNSHF